MDPERVAGLAATAWLVATFAFIARSVVRGRRLADTLAARHPETYEALGRPRPGFFASARRMRFAQFVSRRGYQDLGDPSLAGEFDAYRKSEARLVVSVFASGAALAALVLAVRWGR